MSADELKAKGNAAFSAGDFEAAMDWFGKAIEVDPTNHVLFSNRSAAAASLKQYDQALEDASKCVALKPEWAKGYSRLGAARFGLGDLDSAAKAYEDGLKLDPSNEQLQSGLSDVQAAKEAPPSGRGGGGGLGGMFNSPDVMAKLAMDPRTRGLLGTPSFTAMMRDLQNNPSAMGMYMANPQFQLVLEVALGLKMSTGAPGGGGAGWADAMEEEGVEEEKGAGEGGAASASARSAASNGASDHTQIFEEAQETSGGGQAKASSSSKVHGQTNGSPSGPQAEALKAKEAGNEAYKAKRFEEAIQHYNKALELYDQDISFLTNRAAVYFEMGQYEQCMADCDTAVEKGREIRADYKLVAKAMARKASALTKMEKLEDAIALFHKSLTEHRNADTLKKLNDTEKLLKEQKEKAYISMDVCNEEREKGNAAFKEGRFPDAVTNYTEALKRGPPAVNPEAHKLYSNLAASYIKLGAYPEGLKSAEKCLELDPSFARGYTRKATCQYFMKEYEKAMSTYRLGLKLEPDNEEMLEGVQRCVTALSRFASGMASEEEVKERQARSMSDPDVQNILRDPIMQNVLRDFQENPKAAQAHLKQPDIMAKLNKLVAAGIVQLK